jgi:hypothetical protein
MTSTTAPQHTMSTPTLSLPSHWSPMARLRRAARTASFIMSNAVSATKAYEGAHGPTARRAVLAQFSDDLR